MAVCSNYLIHVLAKLDDNSVPVKKAAIKVIRQYPQVIANNSFALQRLTRFKIRLPFPFLDGVTLTDVSQVFEYLC